MLSKEVYVNRRKKLKEKICKKSVDKYKKQVYNEYKLNNKR